MPDLETAEMKKLAEKFGKLLKDRPILDATLRSCSSDDFHQLNEEAVQIISMLSEWRASRMNASKHMKNTSNSLGIRNYQRLLLQETSRKIVKSLKVWRGFWIRLSLAGLNIPFSNFYLNDVLSPQTTKTGPYEVNFQSFKREKPFLIDVLRESVEMDDAFVQLVDRWFDRLPDSGDISVLTPGDDNYPTLPEYFVPGIHDGSWDDVFFDPSSGFGGGSSGGGFGGGGGGGGGIPDVPIPIDKGISRWFVDFITDFINGLDYLVVGEWTIGDIHDADNISPISRGDHTGLGQQLINESTSMAEAGVAGIKNGIGTGSKSQVEAGIGIVVGACLVAGAVEVGEAIGEGLAAAYWGIFGGAGFVDP